ncbi:MAG: hypothetical protein MUF75_12305 [Bacteroidia bacterium]|jgi:hypothetical protein|nr:hypothetical protein [Bacteroidia bacterium]
MKNTEAKYNYKLLFASAICLVVAAGAFYFYWDTTKFVIRQILESKFTAFILWVLTVLVFLFHYFKHKSKEIESEPILTKKFGAFIDNILGGVGYATAITTSLTLLKGIYIQKFYSDKTYFVEFQDLDLMTIFGVTLFLLYFSVMKVIDIAKETYKVEHTEQVLNEQGKVVNPDVNSRLGPNANEN